MLMCFFDLMFEKKVILHKIVQRSILFLPFIKQADVEVEVGNPQVNLKRLSVRMLYNATTAVNSLSGFCTMQ